MSGAGCETAIADFLQGRRFDRLGIAVSGGSDSTALLHLLAAAARTGGPVLSVVTLDHGRRAEAATEATAVARQAATLGLTHATLHWTWDGTGNFQDQARRARLRLIAEWAGAQGIGAVALGHTLDDQAETFLMRLGRGAGLDGLTGMAPERRAMGIAWLRPLLGCRRDDLRDYLQDRGIGWAEDPSNDDPAYDRVKARRVLAGLAEFGLDAAALAATAARLATARAALGALAETTARQFARIEAGEVVLDRQGFLQAPRDTRQRLLSAALRWVASAEYGPRFAPLAALLAAIEAPGTVRRALHGCLVSANIRHLRIGREAQAIRDTHGPTGEIWDRRWRLSGPETASPETVGTEVRMLGEAGLKACPQWRQTRLPRNTVLTSPAVWRGTELLAAPLAGHPAGWHAELAANPDDYLSLLLSH